MTNRTYCDTLSDMRRIINGKVTPEAVAILKSLIEECQVYGNRMESGLYDKHDFAALQDDVSKLRKEVTALEAQKKCLEDKD